VSPNIFHQNSIFNLNKEKNGLKFNSICQISKEVDDKPEAAKEFFHVINEVLEREKDSFKDKVILLNTDDPSKTTFFKFRFDTLKEQHYKKGQRYSNPFETFCNKKNKLPWYIFLGGGIYMGIAIFLFMAMIVVVLAVFESALKKSTTDPKKKKSVSSIFLILKISFITLSAIGLIVWGLHMIGF